MYKFRCQNCSEYNRLKGSFTDRRELAETKGEPFRIVCSVCGRKTEVKANSVTATETRFLGLIFPLVFVPAILLGYYLFTNFIERNSIYLKLIAIGFALKIPAIIYSALSKSERDKVRNFNRYKL
ncbi:MAG: hypothetical protein CMN32_11160 [Saprospirales bacterium]|nr:hypothetical protein [Saprospirales bacterium]